MNLFMKKYSIKGWNGKEYLLTAKQLYERVLEDSKSDYNWIASATELVRVCSQIDFPEEYAQKIKIMILNCFANLETKQEYYGSRLETDNDAVYSCYNSLKEKNNDIIEVKRKYLLAIIKAIVKYNYDECRFPIHAGPAYNKICNEWKESKFEEYILKEEIDLKKMKKDLYIDFDKTISIAEENGVFEEDDKRNEELLQKNFHFIKLEKIYYK